MSVGDYVDRGKQSLETICLLLAYKVSQNKYLIFFNGTLLIFNYFRLNIPRTSSCCEETMSVPPSTEFTDFTMNVSPDIKCISQQFDQFCIIFVGKRRYNIKLWKTFTDCFNCLPVAAIVDEKIFCCHGGLSPDLQSMEQIRYGQIFL